MNIKQQQILNAAFTLFYQRGFHAVGINEIIKKANVAKKTLYHHFPSKNELIIATLELHHQQIIQHLEQSIECSVPGKDCILVIFEQLSTWIEDKAEELPTFNGCYFNQAYSEFSVIDPGITATCLSHKEAFKNILQKQVDDFESDADKNQLLVDLLILLKEGVIANAMIFTKNNNSAQQAIHYIENILRFKR